MLARLHSSLDVVTDAFSVLAAVVAGQIRPQRQLESGSMVGARARGPVRGPGLPSKVFVSQLNQLVPMRVSGGELWFLLRFRRDPACDTLVTPSSLQHFRAFLTDFYRYKLFETEGENLRK